MQIFVRFYPFVIVCSVIVLHKGFLEFILLMDCVACLKHLALDDYELGCGFLLFWNFKQFLGLFLLFALFGLKFLCSDWFSRVLFRFLCDLRGKSGELENRFSPEYILNGKSVQLIDKSEEIFEKSNGELNTDSDGEEYDYEPDVLELKKMLKIERFRANTASSELEKERAAAATAAAEAMAMILKLQREKSSIEMELSQYRRLSDEKQIHDQEVIKSLQWLVLRHESERSLLENHEFKSSRRKSNQFSKVDDEQSEEDEETESCFNGGILDALENVLYSSRDDDDTV